MTYDVEVLVKGPMLFLLESQGPRLVNVVIGSFKQPLYFNSKYFEEEGKINVFPFTGLPCERV